MTLTKKQFKDLAFPKGGQSAAIDIRPDNTCFYNGIKYVIRVVDNDVILDEVK